MDSALQVVLVDDDPNFRLVLHQLLTGHGGFDVVGEAGNGADGIELAAKIQPDIVVLDLKMPSLSGQEALPTLVRRCPRTMVLVLSALEGTADNAALLEDGAFAFSGKSRLESLPAALEADYALFAEALEGTDTVASWRRGALPASA